MGHDQGQDRPPPKADSTRRAGPGNFEVRDGTGRPVGLVQADDPDVAAKLAECWFRQKGVSVHPATDPGRAELARRVLGPRHARCSKVIVFEGG
jgi:hypothetical protein